MQQMDDDAALVLKSEQGAVVRLVINRPKVGNSLSVAMITELRSALAALEPRNDIKVIILSGAGGRIFCAGHDLGEFAQEQDAHDFSDLAALMQDVMAQPQIVIAKVEGVATAAGCELVAACDLDPGRGVGGKERPERPALAGAPEGLQHSERPGLPGCACWRFAQPWNSAAAVPGLPRNAVSGRAYSGVNVLILWGAVIEGCYPSQDWLTFRQALAAGGCVRKGERGHTVFYADRFTPEDGREQGEGAEVEPRSIPFLKRFVVFNAAQCDGLPARLPTSCRRSSSAA